MASTSEGKCPFAHSSPTSNKIWWPESISLEALYPANTSPYPAACKYGEAFESICLKSLKEDLTKLMTSSQSFWPADYGHYGPFFIRMAWHSAGTYRVSDGKGGGGSGQLRFAPLNSWPDNGNLDKARRLLWPVKKKYGASLSWADLMILAGNVALESMGFETFGFGGGREDAWQSEEVNWGSEQEWLGDERYSGERDLSSPLAAVQMGLIYVNPEGPNGNPDPAKSAVDIRETFARMAMNDEETVALIAGGHTFGKCHGAADPGKYVGVEPEAAAVESQGIGWKNKYRSGVGDDTITSGIEGAWTTNPIAWDNGYFQNLWSYDWELTKSPAGAIQWKPNLPVNTVPLAHDTNKKTHPIMTTADMALKVDPSYAIISRKFYENPNLFKDAFARAWYKLTHRDMGPHVLLFGQEVPPPQPWQDPIPPISHALVSISDVAVLKDIILATEIAPSRLILTAWASASSFRKYDKRGGANGARVRLSPQKDWEINQPSQISDVISALFNIQSNIHKQISIADLIVLAGCAGIEAGARLSENHRSLVVPFNPGRTDAIQEQTEVESIQHLKPLADGFRNYLHPSLAHLKHGQLLVQTAHRLSLNIAEMVSLIGGFRALSVGSTGFLTDRVGVLSNDFFVNLLDIDTEWSSKDGTFQGRSRSTDNVRWNASQVELIFGSHAVLRAYSEVYASDEGKFVQDFVNAFVKVMELDRFGLKKTLNLWGTYG